MFKYSVLFDLDGTLIDSAYAIRAAISNLRVERGGDAVDMGCVRPWISRSAADMVQALLGPLGFEPDSDLAAFRAHYQALGPESCRLYPGAISTLSSLRQHGAQIGICSNKPQALTEWVLDSLELTPFFGAIVGGGSLPAKPNAAPVLRAFELLGNSLANSVFVGDSETDAAAAAAATVPFVLVNFGYPSGRLEDIPRAAHVDSLAELPGVLARLFDQALSLSTGVLS